MNKNIFFALIFSILFIACDKVDDPLANSSDSFSLADGVEYVVDPDLGLTTQQSLIDFISNNTWDTTNSTINTNKRNVLIEEFTGHRCTFCPNGTREIERLINLYGDQIIAIAIHAGSFAKLAPPDFTTDFRVPGGHGETYQGDFNVSGYPSGVISRLSNAQGLAQWETLITSIKDDTPLAEIKITNYYSSSVNAVRSQVEVKWKQTLTENHNLQLQLIEDHIIDTQLDGSTKVPNYDHRHVLRKVINDTYGKSLKAATIDETETFQYIFPVDTAWNADNMEVVAFTFKNETNSKEVLQVAHAHIH